MTSLALLFRSAIGREEKKRIQAEYESDSVVVCHVAEHPEARRAPFPMCFTRSSFAGLINSVGRRPPESGAMGFGPMNGMGIDLIEFDHVGSGNSGGAVYRPHVEWCDTRREFHQNQPDSKFRMWNGFLHSHPGGFGSPSWRAGKGLGDLGYVEETFLMNEWMEYFFIPILTGSGTDEITIHPWICRRGNPLEVLIADFQICRSAASFPAMRFNPEWEKRSSEAANEKKEKDRSGEQTGSAAVDKESAAVDQSVVVNHKSGAYRPAVSGRSATSADTEKARTHRPAAGCVPAGELRFETEEAELIVEASRTVSRTAAVAEYTKRLGGIVSESFHQKSILVVGVGAGSYMVEKLARLSPRSVTLCDFDTVELANLARTAYRVSDAVKRRFKVDALKLRLNEVNPWVDVVTHAKSLTDMSEPELNDLFDGIDLVFGGTDTLAAQALVNEESVRRHIPAVFIGIHAGAQGGRVIWSIPGQTPCYRCVARDRFEAGQADDGQRTNLQGVNGSILDCQFIDMIATKVGVAILERGQHTAMGSFLDKMKGRTDVVIRCDPDYEWGKALWGAVLADLPKNPKDFARELNEEVFLAMDSIWLKTAYDSRCPACGNRDQK